MTDDRVCFSHDEMWERIPRIERPRPCVRRGLHYAACEDPETCRGCVPRSALYGYLCAPCHDKTVDALSRAEQLVTHLRSVEKPAQAMGERVHTSMERSILMPDSWIAADGLLEALGGRPIPSTTPIDDVFGLARDAIAEWADLETIENTREGAKRALVLVRRMQVALRRWPDSEAEYRYVPFILCPNCEERHLFRRAPLQYLDELLIECSTPGCTYQRDWFQWVEDYKPILEGIFREQDRAKRAERRRKADAA